MNSNSFIENKKIIISLFKEKKFTKVIKLGKKLGKNKNIVTILCDYGTKYESKIFNKVFLKKANLPIPEWL